MPSCSAPSRSTVHAEASIEVELAYSPRAGIVELSRLRLPSGSTAGQALKASGLLDRHPGLDAATASLGLHGRPCEAATVLRNGDRLELYRELRVDPKEARRQRYRAQAGPGKR
jgi:uncharacterized protein